MCLGTLGVVTKVWTEDGVPLASVDTGATTETACLLGAPEAREGVNVLVHMGFVVEVLEPDSAEEANRLRREALSEGERR